MLKNLRQISFYLKDHLEIKKKLRYNKNDFFFIKLKDEFKIKLKKLSTNYPYR